MIAAASRKTNFSIRFPFYLLVWCSLLLLFLRTKTSHGFVMPFGASHGDKKLNGQRQILQLNEDLNFLGKVYHSVEVTENGIIRFLESSEEPEKHIENMKPQILPLDLSIPFVAAFWTDADLTNNGIIWFKQETNSTELTVFEKLISSSFPSNQQQKVKWAFIVTWEVVAFIKGSGNNSEKIPKKNTFQAALLSSTEGRQFLLYNYINLTWGDWKQMPHLNRTSSAVVGYDGGNKNSFLMLSGPGPNDIITGSNVNISGLWIFRIDRSPCLQKNMTGIMLLAVILSLLIGVFIGVLCTCYCLRRMKKREEDTQPLDDNVEPPATIKSSEELSILPPSNPSAPVFPTYAANSHINTTNEKPPPRKIRVIKKQQINELNY